ncbi:MAG: hypothetical protein K8T89_21285 [Planctomycetes bacterium]|nr:hypothetical protein [Planctomycetota bacterium]
MRFYALLGLSLAMLTAVPTAWAQQEDPPVVLTGTRMFRQSPAAYPNFPASPYSSHTVDPIAMVDTYAKIDPTMPPNQLPPASDQFAGATETGTQPGGQFNPAMFGDLIGISGRRIVSVGPPTFIDVPVGGQGNTQTYNRVRVVPTASVRGIPLPGYYNGFKAADNENVRPVDRIYFGYNYYSNIARSVLPASIPDINQSQQIMGFEKTFLNGDASIGMRLPFTQINGFSEVEDHVIGDLSFRSKFAWINDRQTGNVFSTGLMVTVPTGGTGDVILEDGTVPTHSTLIQPWGGFIYNLPRVYFQGFSSVVIPTSSRDPTILFNSISAGYWLYRSPQDRLITGFIPTVELHLNTPLNHRNPNDVISFQDQFNITSGAYILFPRMVFGAAVCVPVMGPRAYDIEGMASLSFNF